MKDKKKEFMHRLFRVSIFIKGIDGILEFIGSLILFFVSSSLITNFVETIFQHELTQDPTDLIANYLINTSLNISLSTQLFAAIYLFIHGVTKIGIVLSLWYNKLRSYPLAGFILFLFVVYQIFRLIKTPSLILLFLTIIDIIILLLLGFEYKRLKSLQKNRAT